jgi:predicted negative regulator of RcsB-dependent stress response
MALDIDDEMQADQIKNFWDTYKKIITIGFVILIVAYISFQFYLSSAKKIANLRPSSIRKLLLRNLIV